MTNAPRRGKQPGDVVWQHSKVGTSERERLLGQRAVTVWFTGLPGSGKSTLAFDLEWRLIHCGRACFVLDGDNVRQGLNGDLGFTPDDRRENIRRVAEVARLMNDAGLIVISAFISPYDADRRMARAIVGEGRFVEAYLSANVETCERRDPKGLYARARSGQVSHFTGVSAPYEVPECPDIVLATGEQSVSDCTDRMFAYLMTR